MKFKIWFPVGVLAAFSLVQAVAQTVSITVNGQPVCTNSTVACTVDISVGPGSGGGSTSTGPTQSATTPAFSPAVGTYSSTQLVSLSSSTAGAQIYYTTNGAAPTTSSSLYSQPISVSATTTIKAMAVASGYNSSSVVSATYTINTAPTGTALTACQAINAAGSYYLANDVTCGTQGFALNANNISLNLNGHTIYYGNTSSVAPAISICDNWYTNLPQVACGNGAHANPTVYGGKIVQVAGTTPFTHAIWIGEGNGIGAGYFHDLAITIQEPGTEAIFGDYPGYGWKIQNNTITDKVTNIEHPGQGPLSARSQFQGMVIQLNNGDNAAPPAGKYNVISGNTILGSPQGGIYDTTQNSQIYSNNITLSSSYSNDYGVTIMADGQLVHDNVISGRGRGLDAESSNFQLYNNTINVHEEANNSEYNGCELAGSDGIRVKNYAGNPSTTNGVVKNNTITVSGQYCEANGIALSQLTGGSLALSSNTVNIVPGSNASADASGNGYYVIRYDQVTSAAAVSWSKNSFTGHGVYIYWDGADTTVQAGQTWKLTGSTVYAIDGGSSTTGFPQVLAIADTIASPKVFCGSDSTAMVKVGGAQTQCN
jgi:Chitobiase/beta-hexosaminidase C-terminal domain